MRCYVYGFTLFCLFLVGISNKVVAQTAEIPSGKKTVIVDFFSHVRGVPYAYVDAVRAQVIKGFMERGRQNVIDAENVDNMKLSESEVISHPKALMGRHPSEEELRMEAIHSLGADFIISGTVTKYELLHKDRNSYSSTFYFNLTSLDVATGESTAHEAFKLLAIGDSPERSDKNALERIPLNMTFYIDNHFKFQTTVLRVEPPTGKGKYKELYIHSGSDMGVQNGDLFDVFQETNIGGALAKTKIGKIRAKEVCGNEVTKCSIRSGGEEMANAFQNGDKLIVISEGQALF